MLVVTMVAAWVAAVAAVNQSTVKVTLKQGDIQGSREEAINGRVYYSFKTIPYAKPPVGPLRFKDPEPAPAWRGVRKGSLHFPKCPQPSVLYLRSNLIEGQEDCLYLNVYTPRVLVSIPGLAVGRGHSPREELNTGGSNGDCECGVPNLNRIVNGATVSPAHKYPWHVGLRTRDDASYWCGGTIISKKYVLTAAHCFFNNEGVRESDEGLVVGVADHDMSSTTDDVKGVTRLVNVKKVIIHPKYNTETDDHDVAVLLLEETLDLSKNKELRAVCLPKDDSKTYEGMTGIASGWGRLKDGGSQPDKLQEVELPILAPSCWDMSGVTANMLCAGYKDGSKDTCQGDSGGPLYVKEGSKLVQVGVTSFGFRNCADPGYPGGYARVSKFLPWLKATTADAAFCQ